MSVLLAHGADGSMRDKKGITPVQLTSNPHIRAMLGSGETQNSIQGSTLTFEGTCQVGQVNFHFYMPDIILTCPAKGVIE